MYARQWMEQAIQREITARLDTEQANSERNMHSKVERAKKKGVKFASTAQAGPITSYKVNLDAMRAYSLVSGREKTTNELPRHNEGVLGNELDTT